MLEFITKKISNKIIFYLFLLMTASNILIIYVTVSTVEDDGIKTTKQNLHMLNSAIFQSLRNAMNSGDPIIIQKAEEEARNINGVSNLTIAKSKGLIELYSPDSKFTTDPEILDVFKTKDEKIIEKNNGTHVLRLVKPMVATDECLMCHANQAKGDVIGVMDLTFSMEQSDQSIKDIMVSIFVTSTILGWITLIVVFIIV